MTTTDVSRQAIISILIVSLIASSPGGVVAQSSTNASVTSEVDPWPRQVASPGGATMKVYQPQLDSWTGNILSAYTAVAIRAQGSSDTTYGVIWFTAHTEVDKVNRMVTLYDFNLTKYKFPSLANNGSQYAQDLKADLSWSQAIPLDMLETSLATTAAADQQKKFQVKNQI